MCMLAIHWRRKFTANILQMFDLAVSMSFIERHGHQTNNRNNKCFRLHNFS